MPLKKQLGLLPVILSGIGIILGAGIYALVGKAAGVSGYAVWLGFLIASIVALLTGLSYAELSSMIPKAGAEFSYAKKAFGRKAGFATGWILVLAGVISSATVALGFGSYFQALFGVNSTVAALAILAFSTGVIYIGVKQSTSFAALLSVIEALGLVFIIAICFPAASGPDAIARIFDFSSFSIISVIQTAALVFFAFIGFEEIVRLAEETHNAERNIPKALLISIIICTLLYILVSISAVSVLSPSELASSSAPLGDVAGRAFGWNAFLLLSIIALFSTANTVLLILLATSRIIYGIADDKELPHIIAKVDKKTGTPVFAVALSGLFAACFLFLGKIETVAQATDFLLFIAFAIVNLAAIKLRFSNPKTPRPFRIPLSLGKVPVPAVLGLLACVMLMLGVSLEIFALCILLVIAGVLFEHFYLKRLLRHG